MRWPLRYQIMLPMAGLMLATLVGVSLLNAWMAARRSSLHIGRQLQEITRTLDNSSFPLTDSVLRQMRGLSGAEFALRNNSGSIVASTVEPRLLNDLPAQPAGDVSGDLGRRVRLEGVDYFHTAQRLTGRQAAGEGAAELHILYPEAGYREAWQAAVVPPLAIGIVALLFSGLSAGLVAARLSRPISRLRLQVEHIAQGAFDAMELPQRHDEIRDLVQSVNRMSTMLTRYENDVRRTERLRTLAQLGGGIAHQLRNSATGCRMALDLHAGQCPLGEHCEELEVARRQLQLMEKYIQRILTMGRQEPPRDRAHVDLAELIDHSLPLVKPAAVHAGVDLRWDRPESAMLVRGAADELEQMLINLVLNAIEAAARGESAAGQGRRVEVVLKHAGAGHSEIHILDSGAGPAASIQPELFEPFVSEKPDGVGLGLSVAREVATRHGGAIQWMRREDVTCFIVRLPVTSPETDCVETAGR
jgi:signal transduction histidine kinase